MSSIRIRSYDIDRFWAGVHKTPGCWNWVMGKFADGYGAFCCLGAAVVRAHRYSWVLHNGFIPHGLCVLHHCDNPTCVNPGHLFVGTRIENNLDRDKKGRVPKGADHCNAILTPVIVRKIRRDRLAGLSYGELGLKYGIKSSHARKVAKRWIWKHVD